MVPSLGRSPTLLVGVVLLALVGGAVAPAVAAPPPEPFCHCGDAVESGAEQHGLNLTVTNTTATISVHEDGSATWTVSATVEGDTTELRENATLRDAVVDGAAPATLRSSSVRGDTLVARFDDEAFAERSGGVLRTDAFTNHPDRHLRLASLGADELTVVAPDGMVVGRTVPGSTVSDDGSRLTLTSLDERAVGHVVTFEPRGSALAPVQSLVAVGGFHAPTVASHVGLFVLPSALVFALTIGVVGGGVSWFLSRTSVDGEFVPTLLTVLGVVTTLLTVVGAITGNLFGTADSVAIGVCLGFTTLGIGCTRLGRSYRAMAGATVAAVFVATLGAVGVAVAEGASLRAVSMPMTVALFVVVFAVVPTGYAFGRERHALAVGTATLGFVCFACALLPLTAPTVGLGGFFVFAFAVGYPILASALLAAGVLLARDELPREGHRDTDRVATAD